jgi:hypothetical protein
MLAALPALPAPPALAAPTSLLVLAAALTPEPVIVDVPPLPSRDDASASFSCLDAQAKKSHASKQNAD